MSFDTIKIRKYLKESDITNVRYLTDSTGLFHDYEVEIAVELIVESLNKGVDKSGYKFIFADLLKNDKVETIGYACYGKTPCTLSTFDLYWIVVDKSYAGKKYGSLILANVETDIVLENGRKIYVETSSRETYKRTRSFYLKNKYLIEAELKDFYDIDDNKVIFSKTVI